LNEILSDYHATLVFSLGPPEGDRMGIGWIVFT